jgi:hypothetical protein
MELAKKTDCGEEHWSEMLESHHGEMSMIWSEAAKGKKAGGRKNSANTASNADEEKNVLSQ